MLDYDGDGDPDEMPTKEKTLIFVDTYARWRIDDALRFYQAVRDERGGQSRLDDIVDGETRNAIASYDLIEIVRSSDREFQLTGELEGIMTAEAVADGHGPHALPLGEPDVAQLGGQVPHGRLPPRRQPGDLLRPIIIYNSREKV